jgi:hypothetical protein
MIKRLFVPAALAIALLTNPATAPAAQAEAMLGNKLLEACTSKNPNWLSYCRGFIMGVVYGTYLWTNSPTDVALPGGADDTQLTDIVVRYLKAHPEFRHLPGHALITDALREAFPAQPEQTAAKP